MKSFDPRLMHAGKLHKLIRIEGGVGRRVYYRIRDRFSEETRVDALPLAIQDTLGYKYTPTPWAT